MDGSVLNGNSWVAEQVELHLLAGNSAQVISMKSR